MSASDPNSKIDLLDGPEVVNTKLKKAHCAPKEAEGNGVLSFVEYVLFPIAQLTGKNVFHVPRPEKHGGPVDYTSFEDLKAHYLAGDVTLPFNFHPTPTYLHIHTSMFCIAGLTERRSYHLQT